MVSIGGKGVPLRTYTPTLTHLLFSLPIASCGLKLDDEAARVAVGQRLCLDLCVPHECHCGSRVDVRGVHSFVCKRAPGRTSRLLTLGIYTTEGTKNNNNK